MDLTCRVLRLRWHDEFCTAVHSAQTVDTVILRLTAAEAPQISGWGEAAVLPDALAEGGSAAAVVAQLEQLAADRALTDLAVDDDAGWDALLPSQPLGPSARAGLTMARLDLRGKIEDRPVWAAWSESVTSLPKTSYTVGATTGAPLRAAIERGVRDGHEIFKVKVGNPLIEDDATAVARIEQVREAAPDAVLRVDTNGSWDLLRALRMLPALVATKTDALEEPLCGDASPAERQELRRRSSMPILADEQGRRWPMADVAACYDGINVKPGAIGGLVAARRMIAEAHDHGLVVMLGCNAETSLSITASAQLAPLVEALDLDSALLLADDPFDGAVRPGGMVQLSAKPGLGVTVRTAAATPPAP